MPTFYATGTIIQLSTAPLDHVTTANPFQNKCPQATREVEDILSEFAHASKDGTLSEDAFEDEVTKSHVRFLGENRDLPFFMVHCGKNNGANGRDRRTKRPARVPPLKQTANSTPKEAMSLADLGINPASEMSRKPSSKDACQKPKQDTGDPRTTPPQIPQALCLTVFLSQATFIQTDVKKTKKSVYHDIKIDVFFNGTLTNSTIVPSRYHSDINAMTEHIVRFTGRRLSRMLEKPWVINPSSNGFEDHDMAGSPILTSSERSKATCAALLREANCLGRDRQGIRPALGQYLESIANLPIPKDAQNHDFGVIDAIVTYGRGAKLGPDTSYLTGPTPIKLLGFGQYAGPDDEQLGPSKWNKAATVDETFAEPAITLTNGRDMKDAITRSSRAYRFTSTIMRETAPKTPENAPHEIPHLLHYLENKDSPSKRAALSTLEADSSEIECILKRPSKKAFHSIVHSDDTPMIDGPDFLEPSTPCPTLRPSIFTTDEDSRTQAASALLHLSMPCPLKPPICPRPVNIDSSPTFSSTPPASTRSPTQTHTFLHPAPLTRTSLQTLLSENTSTRTFSRESSQLTSPPPSLSDPDDYPSKNTTSKPQPKSSKWVKLKYTQPLSSHASSGSTDTSPFLPPKASATGAITQPSTPKRSCSSTARIRGNDTPAAPVPFDKNFRPGLLNEGCRIGYAEPGVVRNIGSVRGGWFREVGGVMGVRFVVG